MITDELLLGKNTEVEAKCSQQQCKKGARPSGGVPRPRADALLSFRVVMG